MPALATGLPFYRKKQSLDSLSNERAQNLQSVYNIVRDNIDHVLEHVKLLEHSFYGPGGSLETEVRRWMPVINQVIRPAKFSHLISLSQLEAISDRVHDPTDRLTIQADILKQVYDLVDKVRSAVQDGLVDDKVLLGRLMEFMHKYCLSFSSTEGEAYLETATNYEKQKRELEKAISINLQNILLMMDMFEKEALKIHQFDFIMKEAGEKAGCTQAALLLVFPAACHHMRNACKGLQMWLEADVNYASFIQLDITELQFRKGELEKTLQQHVLIAGELEHQVKSVLRELSTYNSQLKTLAKKKTALETEEKELRKENKDVLVDLDIKDYRCQEMKLLGNDASLNFIKLTKEIEMLKNRKPTIDRKLQELHKKQDIIIEKQMRYTFLEAELEKVRVDLRATRKAARKAKVEVEKADTCLDKLREIYRLKGSPETLKKIFHGMSLSPRHDSPAAGVKNKRDKLDMACQVVAQNIDTDWIQLYHALPYHPPRGEHIITKDIDEISTRFMRHNMEEQARQSLAKWRRLHNRACIEDLRSALQAVKRLDVLERLNVMLTPRTQPCMRPKRHRTVHFPEVPTTNK